MVPRYSYLRWCFDQASSHTFVAKNTLGNIVGYGGTLPINEELVLLGPIYANNPDIAKYIILEAMKCVPENSLLTFVSRKGNAVTEELVNMLGMTIDLSTTRIQTKKENNIADDKVYTYSMAGYLGMLSV